MSREPDPYRDDEDDVHEYAPQSIFAAGWFRAVLVLTVLAIVVVVSLPYLLNWFEPAPPSGPPQPSAGVGAPAAPPAPAPVTPPPATAPAPGAPPVKAEADKPPAPTGSVAPPAAAKPQPSAGKPPAATKPPALPDKQTAAAKPAAGPREAETRQEAKASAPARPAAAAPRVAASGKREYWVQLGLFKEAANAETVAKAVRADGFTVEIDRVTRSAEGERGTYHVVRVGRFPDLEGATKARNALRAKGHQGFIAQAGSS